MQKIDLLVTAIRKFLRSAPGQLTFAPVSPERPVDPAKIQRPRAEAFPDAGPAPWLDRADANSAVADARASGRLSVAQAKLCQKWIEDGYVVLRGFFEKDALDLAWAAYEQAILAGELTPQTDRGQDPTETIPGRVLNPHFKVSAVEAIWSDSRMVDLISLLLGVTALPFQTIMGHKGSQQMVHSDSIHMTTYPQGYLAANWIAFEDIHPDSGPLVYYPGSHRLPYAYSREVGISIDEGSAGYSAYHSKYEPFVQEIIRDHGLHPAYFEAKKGDVLIWHANLLHGGSPRKRRHLGRKALVCHYFAEGCLCYHDYTGTWSHLHSVKRGTTKVVKKQDFNAEAYLAANPDVAEAGADAYQHYTEFGIKEGRPLEP